MQFHIPTQQFLTWHAEIIFQESRRQGDVGRFIFYNISNSIEPDRNYCIFLYAYPVSDV